MEEAGLSETSICIYQTTQRHIPECHAVNVHHDENFKTWMYKEVGKVK
jgi:hypothetical protein